MAYTAPSTNGTGINLAPINPSGATFAQFQASGASGLLEKLIAANLAATAAPSAPTLSATGGGTTGGNLAAGTVYVKVTETNGIGETTASTEVSAAISAGNIPQVTFAALQTGNVARNVYVGMATGAEVLYATGITASTYNLSAAIPTNSFAVPVPTVNTTGLTNTNAAGVVGNKRLSNLRAAEKGRLQDVYNGVAQVITMFNRGEPVKFADVMNKIQDAHIVFATLAQLCAEAGKLIDANPGTLGTTSTPIGGQKARRTQP